MYQNILSFGEKVVKLPNRVLVANQFCEQKKRLDKPESYFVARKLAFEIIENPAASARRKLVEIEIL